MAREILVRYGEREDVRQNLMANFSTGFWTGSESARLQGKIRDLLEFKKDEDNSNVIVWIDEYIDSLKEQLKWAQIREERRGY